MRFREIKVGEEYLIKCFNNEKFECTAKRKKTATLPSCIELRNNDVSTAVCLPADVMCIPKEEVPKVNPAEATEGCYAVKDIKGCLGCCFINSGCRGVECRAPLRKDKCGVIMKWLPEVGKSYRVMKQTDNFPFSDVVVVKEIVGHAVALCANGRGAEAWVALSNLSERPVEPMKPEVAEHKEAPEKKIPEGCIIVINRKKGCDGCYLDILCQLSEDVECNLDPFETYRKVKVRKKPKPEIPERKEQFIEKDNLYGIEYGVGKDTQFTTISALTLLLALLTAIANGITEESITQCRMIQPGEWRRGKTS